MLTNLLAAIIIAVVLVNLLKRPWHDDSDAPGKHSGLLIYTDHKTGVQYLSGNPFGIGLTPRLGKDGMPLIAKPTHGESTAEPMKT